MLDRLALWLGRTTAWCFAAIVLIMVYEVVARYAFNAPTAWAHETSILLASFGFIFGGAFCMAEGTHMRITLLDENRPRMARFSEILSLVTGAIYLAGLSICLRFNYPTLGPVRGRSALVTIADWQNSEEEVKKMYKNTFFT